ncbi:MAG: hypothetical protein ACXW2Q_09550, partial [Thermoanaerobaculia bacterium]
TNGILATRSLLAELVDAGLTDVAFHVDLTEERKGYTTEAQLNEVREEIRTRLRTDRLQKEIEQWTTQLRLRANVDVYAWR